MNIDYNDQRFQQVNQEKQTALNNVNNTYNQMINQSDKYYNDLSKAYEDYGNKQQELQQQRTDFAIDQINQNKEWAKQDYTKEQKGAYQDYMKQTDNYGAAAEQMAQNGLLGTGYAESSRVSMYNAYQNRVATARESYNRSVVDYDNQIAQARMSNNETLAQLAFDTLKAKLEYSLQGFQYKNDLIQTRLKMQNETEDRYYTRWQNVLNQLNTEAQFRENQRQYNEKMAYQRERDRIADEQWNKEYALSRAKAAASSGVSSISKSGINGGNNALSSKGQEVYNVITNGIKTGKGLPFINNKVAKQESNIKAAALQYFYNNGEISESDVRILANKLGI